MNNNHYPAFPLFKANNRKIKRAMQHEFASMSKKTGEIEELFAIYWNRLSDPRSYETLYKTFLDLYIKKVNEIQQKLKPKYIVMNPEYFKEIYGVEFKMIKPSSLFHDIPNFIRMKLWFM